MIAVKVTKKYGRGVYATQPIKKGQVVENAHLILVRDQENNVMGKLALYVFDYKHRKGWCCIALGCGSLFNHRKSANIGYKTGRTRIKFTAKRNIKRGEQLFINYGYDPGEWQYLQEV